MKSCTENSTIRKLNLMRRTLLTGIALLAMALMINIVAPMLLSQDVFAQSTPELSAAAKAAARERARNAAAKTTARERARAALREANRLFPRWDSIFDEDMVEYLETYNINTRNLEEKTFQQIITERGSHSIREDGRDCVSCHGDPGLLPNAMSLVGINESDFCDRLPEFLAIDIPSTNSGHKPKALKFFFNIWGGRNCGWHG